MTGLIFNMENLVRNTANFQPPHSNSFDQQFLWLSKMYSRAFDYTKSNRFHWIGNFEMNQTYAAKLIPRRKLLENGDTAYDWWFPFVSNIQQQQTDRQRMINVLLRWFAAREKRHTVFY